MSRLTEVTLLFLRLGLTAFGGPAAHIAIMHDEVVKRRKWLDDQAFLDLLGATNLIPGPNSTEMAIHLGYLRAGWPGLIAGGAAFILPAMLIVMGLAGLYVRYGATPEFTALLYGIKPVVIAVILQALWNLLRKAVKGWLTGLVAAAVVGLYFLNLHALALLFAGGLVVMLIENRHRLGGQASAAIIAPLAGAGLAIAGAAAPFSLAVLFLTFLKIGAVLYGSGYVLLAFLRSDFVVRLGWLTDQQLLEAIAVGQVTPGPVFTTATFIGFILGGPSGAILATLGIFLPSFIFVALSNPLIPRLRSSPWAGSLLDGVNAASIGLMAAVTWQIAGESLVDLPTGLIFLASAILLIRFKLNSTWLIAGGGVLGLLSQLVW